MTYIMHAAIGALIGIVALGGLGLAVYGAELGALLGLGMAMLWVDERAKAPPHVRALWYLEPGAGCICAALVMLGFLLLFISAP